MLAHLNLLPQRNVCQRAPYLSVHKAMPTVSACCEPVNRAGQHSSKSARNAATSLGVGALAQ